MTDRSGDQFPICPNCGKRPGTVRWGDALAVTHGFTQMWCEVCAVTAQLNFARERAAAIPELEARLVELRAGGWGGDAA